jgi:hypothetical protein
VSPWISYIVLSTPKPEALFRIVFSI